jgi:hypothetical protein
MPHACLSDLGAETNLADDETWLRGVAREIIPTATSLKLREYVGKQHVIKSESALGFIRD